MTKRPTPEEIAELERLVRDAVAKEIEKEESGERGEN